MKNSYWLLNTPKLKLEFPHAFTIAVAKREICKDVKICIALEKNHRKNIQNDQKCEYINQYSKMGIV